MPTFCQVGQKAYLRINGDETPFIFDAPIDIFLETVPRKYMPNAPGAFRLYGKTLVLYDYPPDGYPYQEGWCFVHSDETWRMPRARAEFTAPRSGIASLTYSQVVFSGKGDGVSVSGPKGGILNLTKGQVITWEVDPLSSSDWDWNCLRLIIEYQDGGNKLIVKKNGIELFAQTYPTAPTYSVTCGDPCPDGEIWDKACNKCVCKNLPSLIASARQIKEYIAKEI